MKKSNREKAYGFIDLLDEVFEACGRIQEAGGCERCPIRHNCLDDTSVSEFANFCTKESLDEFLGFAEDVEDYEHEREMDAWEAANRWAGIDPSWATLPRVGRI